MTDVHQDELDAVEAVLKGVLSLSTEAWRRSVARAVVAALDDARTARVHPLLRHAPTIAALREDIRQLTDELRKLPNETPTD